MCSGMSRLRGETNQRRLIHCGVKFVQVSKVIDVPLFTRFTTEHSLRLRYGACALAA